ncbi:SERTA domain-containing protein 4-like isoform X2 [Paramormyrops kingsleyae]|uniref:SERTA domain-containing protein 4-like isoform X2 n=1 Tax=Paramormyrops kingsleyae TaxID=1676925 RepID=UPI003B976549
MKARGHNRGSGPQAESTSVADFSLHQQPNRPTTSKVAYFKRKYAEEEDLHRDFHEYFQQHLILPEDRHCILQLSLEKLRFLEDPEIYLRRSVLINNLLRKLHREEGRAEEGGAGPCTWDSPQRQHYPDAKRLKAVVADCCTQVFAYGEVPRYHVVPGCLYGHPPDCNAQVLIYKLGDNG